MVVVKSASGSKHANTQHADCMRRRNATPERTRFIPIRLLDVSGAPEAAIRVIETT